MAQTVDKELVRSRFRKQLPCYGRHAVLQPRMARGLLEALISLKGRRFARVLEIGCGSGMLTRLVAEMLDVQAFFANDLVDDCRDVVAKALAGAPITTGEFIAGDIEGDLPIPAGLDLVISNATFQWLESLDMLLPRLAASLSGGGVLAFSTFGPQNLREIRDLTGVGLAYPPADAVEEWLRQNYRVLHRAEEVVSMQFATPLDVVAHVRQTGVNAVSRAAWRRSELDRFVASYRERWGSGDSVSLTYHPIVFVAEKC
jgi:malonyl-CoA O-methyltransferase